MKVFITKEWNRYLNYFEDHQKDVYYYEEYVKLYESFDENAFCAICEDDKKIMVFPFIRRKIGEYYDFETAYGYGGPISNTNEVEWNYHAISEMTELFYKEKYVCGFVRFHPLLNNALYCGTQIDTVFDRHTVDILTTNDVNAIWSQQISSKNRNMIRKAEKNCLEYKAEFDFDSIDEFVLLYMATMKRLNADSFYYFKPGYYNDYICRLKGNAFLGTVRLNGDLICAALFLYSKEYGHYHLEGSDWTYSGLGANNLLLWETAKQFAKLGVKEFHLGGGYNSEEDNTLLKFKKSFSNNMKDFYIGKWIFNKEKYEEIKNKWMQDNPEKVANYGRFLLCYRY